MTRNMILNSGFISLYNGLSAALLRQGTYSTARFAFYEIAKERNSVLDEVTRNRRQKKALEALEKDNFQEDVPTSGLYVSDFKLQLNKKLQQRFSVVENPDELNQSASNTSLNNSQSSQFVSSTNLNESSSTNETKKRKLKAESKLRFRKNFAALLEEEVYI